MRCTSRFSPIIVALLFATGLLLSTGCGSFHPRPYPLTAPPKNAFTQTNGAVIVTAAAYTQAQSKQQFDLNLESNEIQPIWMRIQNNSDSTFLLLPANTDPFYYSAAEMARKFKGLIFHRNTKERYAYLVSCMIDEYIPPHTTREGYIFAQRKDGFRRANILLFSEKQIRRFTFLFPGEHIAPDHHHVSFNERKSTTVNISSNDLRTALRNLPCYTANASEKQQGDPLNFIIIGSQNDLFAALAGSGWDETETLNLKSAWRTLRAFVTGASYRFSPVSSLFVFGRRQDAAFQKIRRNIHSRCHLRIWLSPLRYQRRPVWIGQISRDIGIRFTTKTANLTTHVIDPDVDGDRWYLIQELLRQQCLEKIGYVSGGTEYSVQHPGHNLTGDPYFTDGLRAVLFLSNEPIALDELKLLHWANPPRHTLSNSTTEPEK